MRSCPVLFSVNLGNVSLHQGQIYQLKIRKFDIKPVDKGETSSKKRDNKNYKKNWIIG